MKRMNADSQPRKLTAMHRYAGPPSDVGKESCLMQCLTLFTKKKDVSTSLPSLPYLCTMPSYALALLTSACESVQDHDRRPLLVLVLWFIVTYVQADDPALGQQEHCARVVDNIRVDCIGQCAVDGLQVACRQVRRGSKGTSERWTLFHQSRQH